MNILTLSFFFIFGLIIGSFLNVVLFRFNTGRTVGGRSKCFSCKRSLTPVDLVPVLSYIVFGGRCRTCKSHVSLQYPAVEMLTGVLFAAVYLLYAPLVYINLPLFIFNISGALVVMSLLVLITVYDLKHKIIPDAFSYTFAGIAFLMMFLRIESIQTDSMYSIVRFFIQIPEMTHLFAGIILAFPFYFLWLVSRGRWMGLGDAKLALGIGWLLGLAKGATAIMYGFWIGAVVSILIIAIQKCIAWRNLWKNKNVLNMSMKSEIPFAPFLIAGLLIVYFFGYNIFSVLEMI